MSAIPGLPLSLPADAPARDIPRRLGRRVLVLIVVWIAAALVWAAAAFAGGLEYRPQILTLVWADGQQETGPATSPATCAKAVEAVQLGWWPKDRRAVSAHCSAGDIFPPGANCIAGFGCDNGGRR